MRAKPPNSSGLTLLETLLAISMLAMILLALQAALSSGVGAFRRCRDSAERDMMAGAVIRLIADDLQRLMLPDPSAGAPTLLGVPDVAGAGTCLLRLRTNARPAPGAREMLVDYFFLPDASAEAGSLVRRSEPLLSPGGAGAPLGRPWRDAEGPDARYEVIATGVRSVRLRYSDGRDWSEQWDSLRRSGPPRLVEVSVDLAGPNGLGQTYIQALPTVVESPLIAAQQEAQP